MSAYKTFGELATPESTAPSRHSQVPARGHQGSGGPTLPARQVKDVFYFNSADDKNVAVSNHRLTVVDVYADWCGPCKTIAPKVADLASKYNRPGHCLVCKEDAELELSPDVRNLPTFQFYVDGKRVTEPIVGADVDAVERRILELLAALS